MNYPWARVVERLTRLGVSSPLMATIFVSDLDWMARAVCRRHGLNLTERGQVVRGGEVVAHYEVAFGTLALHGLPAKSPLVPALHLRPAE